MSDPRDNFFRFMNDTPGRSRRVVSWATEQPGWVTRVSSVIALLVLAAVVLLLVIPALLIGGLVFLLLSIYVAIRVRMTGLSAGREKSEGRENVRVIRRD
ncbi:MAG: hypothetical protein K8E66_04210 [Phycisphaerales bacterium]|nr:hypothetical protein [Phycisphaerales bacterium]